MTPLPAILGLALSLSLNGLCFRGMIRRQGKPTDQDWAFFAAMTLLGTVVFSGLFYAISVPQDFRLIHLILPR